MDVVRHFARLIEYDVLAGRRVAGAIERAQAHLEQTGEAHEAAPFVRAVEVCAHVQAARRVWLSRMGRCDGPEDGLFPAWSVEKTLNEAQQMDEAWTGYAGQLSGADLEHEVSYTTTEGVMQVNTVEDIVTHVVNHGSYHRGQIARLIKEAGTEMLATDFILYARGMF